MRRASARSSTTTSARARLLAIDWPLTALAAGIGAALAFDDGGYFPPAWGWSALALFWIAALTLFLRDRFSCGRLELALLGSFAAFGAWVALSSTWSSSTERSILEAQRALVYLGALVAVLLVARGRPVAELLVAVCGAALVTSAFGLGDFFFSARGAGARLSEPLGYANAVGLVAAIGALLAVAFAAHARSRPGSAVAVAFVVVFVLTIFFTYSRGSWISLAVGLAVMLAVDPRRAALLRTVVAVARVLGSGAGTFEQFWLAHRRTSANARDAHSLYLETLAELGPAGLALIVATLAVPLLAAAGVRSHPFVPAALAAYLAYLVHAAADWDWEMPAATLLGLFCAAALLLGGRG